MLKGNLAKRKLFSSQQDSKVSFIFANGGVAAMKVHELMTELREGFGMGVAGKMKNRTTVAELASLVCARVIVMQVRDGDETVVGVTRLQCGRVSQVQARCWSRCVGLPSLVREEEELTVAGDVTGDGRVAAAAAGMVMVGEEKN
ncbi:hypothetical protein DEO72_LG7g1113 [Vigna unguiculata]|uniref:Uncharacterized protein n=1 Tax=Vigna unguiculata TaxID=3917 RepID=A0A4D6MFN8_VIGUN|nr:hypothetical protein DEO72_LG7g1113 [Vigna unguiculata]